MLILPEDLAVFAQKIKKEHKTIVFTNGCFDLLHVGHVTYLEEAKKLGDYLIVGLNNDTSIKRLKGNARPLQNEKDRAKILLALRMVDAVTIFSEQTAEKVISVIKPSIYVKGSDYLLETLPERKVVEEYGGKIVLVPYLKNHSTTNLIAKIQLTSE